MTAAQWLVIGPPVVLVLYLVVRAAVAGEESDRGDRERPPLYADFDETEEERDREQ